MDFKVGLSAKPKKDAAIAKVASEGEQNLKDALKEVLDEIGMCMENAQLIDKRVKENAGKAAFEIEKKKAEEGNARIAKLARSLGFDVEDDDEDEEEESTASTDESSDDSSDDDGDGDDTFNFDDDDDDDDDGDSDDDDTFNFDDDDDDDDVFNFD